MEENELKNLWNNYNQKLDKIENIQSDILSKMITKRMKLRSTVMEFQSIIGIFVTPIIFTIVILPILIQTKFTLLVSIGAIIILIILLFSFFSSLKYFRFIKRIKPQFDNLIDTKTKIIDIKKIITKLYKVRKYISPLFGISLLFIISDKIDFNDSSKIIGILILFIAIYFWGNFKKKIFFDDRIENFEKDLEELKDLEK